MYPSFHRILATPCHSQSTYAEVPVKTTFGPEPEFDVLIYFWEDLTSLLVEVHLEDRWRRYTQQFCYASSTLLKIHTIHTYSYLVLYTLIQLLFHAVVPEQSRVPVV